MELLIRIQAAEPQRRKKKPKGTEIKGGTGKSIKSDTAGSPSYEEFGIGGGGGNTIEEPLTGFIEKGKCHNY